jgi:hypothetical protein
MARGSGFLIGVLDVSSCLFGLCDLVWANIVVYIMYSMTALERNSPQVD